MTFAADDTILADINRMMPRTAILVGDPGTLTRLSQQLRLLREPPHVVGCVLANSPTGLAAPFAHGNAPLLGTLEHLPAIVHELKPDVALVSLPAVHHELITRIRTTLRRLSVPDRFMPTLEDQIAGIGPRTHVDIDPATLLNRPTRTIEAAASLITGRRILITGAGGSIGSELARIAAQLAPAHLALMDRAENPLFEIDRQIARFHPHVPRSAILHDVVDSDGATLAHFRQCRPQLIFHAAAHKHVPMMEDHPAAAVDNNLFGTVSVLEASEAVNAERFVMISTDKAVNPTSVMGATKRLAELYVQFHNREGRTACAIVRFGNVLGSSGSVLEVWSKQIAEGGPVTITDPRMTRYFMTIPEAATLVIEAAALVEAQSKQAQILVLDMGQPVPILDLARRFIERHGLQPGDDRQIGDGRMPVSFTGIRPGEKLHEQLAFDSERLAPTSHPSIKVWQDGPPDIALIKEILHQLDPEIRDPDPARLASTVRRLAEPRPAQVAA